METVWAVSAHGCEILAACARIAAGESSSKADSKTLKLWVPTVLKILTLMQLANSRRIRLQELT